MEVPLYERCSGCGGEFLYPHLCREHMLCGSCHHRFLTSTATLIV